MREQSIAEQPKERAESEEQVETPRREATDENQASTGRNRVHTQEYTGNRSMN